MRSDFLFPLCKFFLPFPTLKECLNLWVQNVGNGFYFVEKNACAVVKHKYFYMISNAHKGNTNLYGHLTNSN